MSRLLNIAGALALTGAASAAMAGFVVEDAPSWRGDTNTVYGGWDVFTQANNAPNFADVAGSSMGFAGQVFNFSGTAFITSTGNIYDSTNPVNIHNYVDLAGIDGGVDITDVVVNVATLGTVPALDGVIFQAVTATGDSVNLDTTSYSVNYLNEIPGFGATYNLSWEFDLSAIAGDVTTLAFIIKGAGPHMSLDALSTDVRFNVPAPGALALLGLAGLAGRRRRR
jgi:hypothetical protein